MKSPFPAGVGRAARSPSTVGGSTLCYLLAAVLAVVFFFVLYPDPVQFLLGNGVYFEVGDAPQHVSGWLLYAKDAWRWPLLSTQMISPPEGTHIALTDSIPLAALIFKPIAPVLWDNFHYFGSWHLLTKITQATGAVYLLRSLGQRGLFAGIAAAALALLWPSSLFRYQHTALMTHAVLLYALGFYFRATLDRWSVKQSVAHFASLSLVSLLIHPYLFAMVFPFFVAACLDRWGREREWSSLLAALVCGTGLVAIPALALGYASLGGSSDGGGGFSVFSMNLLAPICGGSITLCELHDATGGQHEGYNTLGLGSLLLIALAIFVYAVTRRADGRPALQHLAFGLLLIGLTLYSLSGHIYAGEIQLTALSPPFPLDRLTNTFRASGRFFWPVSYALVFIALALVLRLPKAAMTSLPLVLLVQWQDISQLRSQTATALTAPAPFDYSEWHRLEARIERIRIIPDHGCEPAIENMKYVYFQIIAGRLGVPINTGYHARASLSCRSPADIDALKAGTLLVDLRPVLGEKPLNAAVHGLRDGTCVKWTVWGGPVLCLALSTSDDWQALAIQ